MEDTPKPPGGLEIERALLGGLLLDNTNANEVVSKLEAKHFVSDKRHAIVFEIITKMVVDGRPFDVLSVSEYANQPKMRPYLQGLTGEIPTLASISEYVKILLARYKRRALKQVFVEGGINLSEGKLSLIEVIDEAEAGLYDLANETAPSDLVSLADLVTTRSNEIDKLIEDPNAFDGVSTGFVDLDRYVGGFCEDQLIIIAGRPSMGKSAFALNLAYNAAKKDKTALFFALEMGANELADRLVASQAQIDSSLISRGQVVDSQLPKIHNAWGVLHDMPMYIDDSGTLTISQLRAKINRHSKTKDLDIVFVDYLQLMEGTSKKGADANRNAELSEITRGLKILAKDFKIPVVALSQLSRSVEHRSNKRPILSDLRDSGSIEQDADIVLMLYRDEYYNPETEKQGVVEIDVKKQRNGRNGVVSTIFKREIQQFYDKAPDGLVPPPDTQDTTRAIGQVFEGTYTNDKTSGQLTE